MARFVIKPSTNNALKVIECSDQADAKRRMIEYYNADPEVQFFRVVAQSDGDFLLRRLRPRAGSEVTRQVVTDVEFEDNR